MCITLWLLQNCSFCLFGGYKLIRLKYFRLGTFWEHFLTSWRVTLFNSCNKITWFRYLTEKDMTLTVYFVSSSNHDAQVGVTCLSHSVDLSARLTRLVTFKVLVISDIWYKSELFQFYFNDELMIHEVERVIYL